MRVLRRQLGALFLTGAASLVVGCGADMPPQHYSTPPPPPPVRVYVSLDASSYLLGLGESVTAVAQVTGTETPASWALDCDTGHASIVSSGNSATITALGGGTCFLSAAEDRVTASASVRIPPLAVGDSCLTDSECGQGAPICGFVSGECGKNCTMLCATAADCPISDAFGDHVACLGNHLCRLVRHLDDSCP